MSDPVAPILATIATSAKYRDIHPDLVRRLAAQSLARYRSPKEALKATKEKLHQIGGAFLERSLPYDEWLTGLAVADGPDAQRGICRAIMRGHTSMRERLPFLEDFYAGIFAELPPIHSVLDVACGLHPLAAPWMPLAPDATYRCCDIFGEMMTFLGAALDLLGIAGDATWADATILPPTPRVDLAFLLKTLPTVEQVDKDAGRRLLTTINARHLVVSFPRQSLGGRNKGMTAFYEAHFRDLLADHPWPMRRLDFPTELVFIVEKREYEERRNDNR